MEIICILCLKQVRNHHDRYLVEGKSKVDVRSEFESLKLQCNPGRKYICKACYQLLAKRRSLIQQQAKLETEIRSLYLNSSEISHNHEKRASEETYESVDCTTPRKRTVSEYLSTRTSTPLSQKRPRIPVLSFPAIVPESLSEANTETSSQEHTEVSIRIKWPSKEIDKKLAKERESLAKMLARGTYKQIAHAFWRCPKVKKELDVLIAKEVEKEATLLCSKKNPLSLRKTGKESMLSFSMEKLEGEIKERAPFIHSCLSAFAVNSKSRSNTPSIHCGAIGMAAAICLRNRSKSMIALQLMITTFLYHSSWMVGTFALIWLYICYHSFHHYIITLVFIQ